MPSVVGHIHLLTEHRVVYIQVGFPDSQFLPPVLRIKRERMAIQVHRPVAFINPFGKKELFLPKSIHDAQSVCCTVKHSKNACSGDTVYVGDALKNRPFKDCWKLCRLTLMRSLRAGFELFCNTPQCDRFVSYHSKSSIILNAILLMGLKTESNS